MINAKFKLNSKEMSSLEINGNKYDAFSGMADYRNKSQYICLAKIGPIPIGTYYIVDR